MASPQRTIVCFGDSNTHGYDASNGGRFDEAHRWPCLLGEMLGDAYRIQEEGLSGRTTAFTDPLFESLNGLSSLYSCIMSHEPIDLLIIMLGTNDVKERYNVSPYNIAQGLSLLLKQALSLDAWKNDPCVLVIAPPPILPDYIHTLAADEMGKGCDEKSRLLAPFFQKTAKEYCCHFLDAASIPGITMNSYDYMHLTPKSHFLLAKKLSEIIPGLFHPK